MWRRLLAICHPDRGAGDDALFVWVTALREHVVGDAIEDARTAYQRRQPPPHPSGASSHSERLDYSSAFDKAADFRDLTAQAVALAESGAVGEPYAQLLRLLSGCYPAQDGPLMRAQHQGASYKALAYAAHLAGMSTSERVRWYRICEQIPLSQRHASHLIGQLQFRAA
jgi:hypothetical protein